MEKVNIIIGRFQPFTKGHYKCIKHAYKKLNIATVICMIDTKEEKVDKKHPFPTSINKPILESLFKNDKLVKDIILVKNADIVKIGEKLYDKKLQAVSWVCGSDRVQSYQKMASKYKEQAHLPEDFKVLEIPRTGEDISATKVRNALLDDNFDLFKKLTPYTSLDKYIKGEDKDIYNIFRKQILLVYDK